MHFILNILAGQTPTITKLDTLSEKNDDFRYIFMLFFWEFCEKVLNYFEY
jgi:hypothetical protein